MIEHRCQSSDWMQGAIGIVQLPDGQGQLDGGWHIVFWQSETEWDRSLAVDFCPYCGMELKENGTVTEPKYAFRLDDFVISVKDVPIDSRITYNNEAVIQKLTEMGPKYCNTGRLTSWHLAQGIGALARKWFYKTGSREIKAHLVIPPELLFHAKTILEGRLAPECITPTINFTSQFIGGVWVDIGIDGAVPNLPWFVFASADLILGSQVNLEGMVYFAGTAP